MPSRRTLRAITQFLVTGSVTWALMAWLGASGHLLYVWPLTAVPLALALGQWRNPADRYQQLAAAAAGEFLAFELLRMPHWIGLISSIVQMIEVFAVGSILPHRHSF